MTIPYAKPPLTFDQQVELLASRGLEIADRSAAATVLAKISYYRFSAYCLPFKNDADRFLPSTKWEDVIRLYEFDRKLRLLVMEALEPVEVALRAAIAYTLSQTYGAFGHHDPNNFRPEFLHLEWLDKLTGEIEKSRETFIQHFRDKYDGFPRLPIWMATEVMSFGSLSRLFEGMQDSDQRKISQPYGIPHYVLRSWLRSLSFIRNVCAHHGRLWNRELAVAPSMPKPKHGWPQDSVPKHQRLFAVLVMLAHLTDDRGQSAVWRQAVNAILEPVVATEKFRNSMGLPEGWQNHPRWRGANGGRN